MSGFRMRSAAFAVGVIMFLFDAAAAFAQPQLSPITQGGFPKNTTIKVTSPLGEVRTFQSNGNGEITFGVEHAVSYMIEVRNHHPVFYYYEDPNADGTYLTMRQWEEPYGIDDTDDVVRVRDHYETNLVKITNAIDAADQACDAAAFEKAKAEYIAAVDYYLAALNNRLRDSDPDGKLAQALQLEIGRLMQYRNDTVDLPFAPCPRLRIGSGGGPEGRDEDQVGFAGESVGNEDIRVEEDEGIRVEYVSITGEFEGQPEYVKVCELYGAGFFYIPGTDTCIRVTGYVRSDFEFRDIDTADAGGYDDAEYERMCEAFDPSFFYIPGTDICIRLKGFVRYEGDYELRRIDPTSVGDSAAAREGAELAKGPAFNFETRSFIYEGAALQFIARDDNGDIVYDTSNVERDGNGFGVEIGADFPLGIGGSNLGFSFGYAFADGSDSGGSPEGTQDRLLVPSLGQPGANPAGRSLSFSGGANAHMFESDWSYSKFSFEGRWGTEIERGAVELYPWAGIRTGITTIEDSFDLEVPGFLEQASYAVDTDVRSFGAFVGITTSLSPETESYIESYFVQVRGGLDINRAESQWRYEASAPGFSDVQEVTVVETYATPYLYGEFGVNFDLSRLFGGAHLLGTISLFGELSDTGPALSLPGGGDEPESESDAAASWGVKATAKF